MNTKALRRDCSWADWWCRADCPRLKDSAQVRLCLWLRPAVHALYQGQPARLRPAPAAGKMKFLNPSRGSLLNLNFRQKLSTSSWSLRILRPNSTNALESSQKYPSADESAAIDLRKPFTNFKKLNDLINHLNQRAAFLAKLENLQAPPCSKPVLPTSNVTNIDLAAAKPRRRTYEEDPEFKFERKRGKRHVMIALKNSKSSGSNQPQKLEAIPELDISLRRPGIKKVTLKLPMEWSRPTNNQETNNFQDQSADQKIQPNQRSEIEEFVQMYLGPLVCANSKVDLSLLYGNQAKPSLCFETEHEDNIGEREIGGLNRSQILHLILNSDSQPSN
ncbi:hypothetical protein O181_063077 [Austropuccinia psidii MF-1]|uniref:Uncharacterized protein n=1 Tax=Austropuccinia psidii MF-1 TaxID=1389203 RepID=A0A9Q3I0Z2_9BASI|nr:hypothetical protein [Austropuccinia psidii MF-1]